MPNLNLNNPESIVEETILKLKQLKNICLKNERDRIANLIHELVTELPFLESLDTSAMSYVDVLRLIAEHCEYINYLRSYAEYDEFEFVLTGQNPNPKISDLVFILFLIFATKNRAVSFCFGLGNINRHKAEDCEALRLISDNSVSILDTTGNNLKFICSIESAFSDYILKEHSEKQSIDDFIFSKLKSRITIAEYFENRETGLNLDKNSEFHAVVAEITEQLIQGVNVYRPKNRNKIQIL